MPSKKRLPPRGACRIKKLVRGLGPEWKGGVVNFDTGWIARKATAEEMDELEALNESPDALEPLAPGEPQPAASARILPLRHPQPDRKRARAKP